MPIPEASAFFIFSPTNKWVAPRQWGRVVLGSQREGCFLLRKDSLLPTLWAYSYTVRKAFL